MTAKAKQPVLRYSLTYLLLFGLGGLANRFDVWLNLSPASIHQWRQADGAALAQHYAQDPDFRTPAIGNLFQTGDAHAVGEWPVLYGFSGLLTRCFGWPAYPLRYIGLVLLFLGGWAFGWLALRQTGRPAVAALCAGLLLSAPVLAYYGPSFLPDAPAFCFILILVACLWQADKRQSAGWLFAGAACAVMAILLKISTAIFPLALAITWFFGKIKRQWPSRSLWNGLWPIVALLAVATAVAFGRAWIDGYNEAHQARYFLASTRPIWRYDAPFIRETFGLAARSVLPVFASAGLYLACLACLWYTIKRWKSASFTLKNLFLWSALGGGGYFLLWFRMFREHDYYSICLLILPALLLLNGLQIALSRWGEKRLLVFLGVCWLLGVGHSSGVLAKRLDMAFHPRSYENLPPDAFLSAEMLRRAGLPDSARVFCPQDPSPNIALLALRRQGWTAYNFGRPIPADTLFSYHRKFGLSHLALRDTAFYTPTLQAFFPEKTAEIKGWYLYAH